MLGLNTKSKNNRTRSALFSSDLRKKQGFTLLEVMLGMAILAIIAGALYGILSASMRAGDQITSELDRQMQAAALVELLRKNFAALPAQCVMTLKVREEGKNYLSELRLDNAPTVFTWGSDRSTIESVVLGLKVGIDGRLQLGVKREPVEQALRRQPQEKWLMLTDELTELRWEVYDAGNRKWMGSWNNSSMLPALIRLRCQWQGDAVPTEVTFAFPWTRGG